MDDVEQEKMVAETKTRGRALAYSGSSGCSRHSATDFHRRYAITCVSSPSWAYVCASWVVS
jgi:hypothetical protein